MLQKSGKICWTDNKFVVGVVLHHGNLLDPVLIHFHDLIDQPSVLAALSSGRANLNIWVTFDTSKCQLTIFTAYLLVVPITTRVDQFNCVYQA